MATIKGHSFRQSRTEQHLRLLNQLDDVALTNNLCNICHCDCYNSCELDNEENSNTNDFAATTCRSHSLEHVRKRTKRNTKNSKSKIRPHKTYCSHISEPLATTKQDTTIKSDICKPDMNGIHASVGKNCNDQKKRRSKSVDASQNQKCPLSDCYYARDCDILHELLNSMNEEEQQLTNIPIDVKYPKMYTSTDSLCEEKKERTRSLCSQRRKDVDVNNNLTPIRLSKSIANLCLLPAVRDAYTEIPTHDKRILNRMAAKRTEQATDKENAWLAQKYWENERYERELLKYEQMEEYKKAIRDKQFQDYLKTKARFNEIAQRDLIELQRLKESIHQKELRTTKRLKTLRAERKNAIKQKQYEEFRRAQAVNLQQAENQLDNILHKNVTYQRLTERLQRADKIRNELLEGHLKRLRYNNYIEQLQHEELWRELQTQQQSKCEQLKATIARKRCRSQQFLYYRQKHMEASRRKATISQNLRELVRSSVSPETNSTLPTYGISGLRLFTANDIYSAHALSKSLLQHDLDTTNAYDKSPIQTI